jgi:hypothetical protein
VTRLAYAVTGDATIDGASKAGTDRPDAGPLGPDGTRGGEPVAVDLAREELAFFPLIYVPIAPNQPVPSQAAIRKLDAFMKNGGTVLFDTRDAMNTRPGGEPSARRRLSGGCSPPWTFPNSNRCRETTS